VLKAEPGNADALGLLGMIALQLGDSEIAADLLCRAVVVQPANPAAQRYLVDAYLNLGRSADAEACYRSSLAQPDDAEVHNRLGTALRVQGRLDEAERSYRRALEYGPALAAGVHNNLGILHALQGRPHAAAEYRRALAIDPGLAEAHCNLGGVLHCLGEAIASLRGALACEPALVTAPINLALAMRAGGQPLEAVQVLFATDSQANQRASLCARRLPNRCSGYPSGAPMLGSAPFW
jgi:protein O-GlcNAc transferase